MGEEGFYEAHLRDKRVPMSPRTLCYLYQKGEETFADLPNGQTFQVNGDIVGPYTLDNYLEPVDPTRHVTAALDLVKFVFVNLQRLEISRRIKKSGATEDAAINESDIPF